jgi:hypothetical protein
MLDTPDGAPGGTRSFGVVEAVTSPSLEARLDRLHALRAPQVDSVIVDASDTILALNGTAADVLGLAMQERDVPLSRILGRVAIRFPSGRPPLFFRYDASALASMAEETAFFAPLRDSRRWVRVTRRPLQGARGGFSLNIVEPIVDNEPLCDELEGYLKLGKRLVDCDDIGEPFFVFESDGRCAVSSRVRKAAGTIALPLALDVERSGDTLSRFVDAFAQDDGVLRAAPPAEAVSTWRDGTLVRLSSSGTWWKLSQRPDVSALVKQSGLPMVVAFAERADEEVAQHHDRAILNGRIELSQDCLLSMDAEDVIHSASASALRLLNISAPMPRPFVDLVAEGSRADYKRGLIREFIESGKVLTLEVSGRLVLFRAASDEHSRGATRLKLLVATVEPAGAADAGRRGTS